MEQFRYISLLVVICFSLFSLSSDGADLSAGGYHFVGINAGEVVGLGDGTYGQLGGNDNGMPVVIDGLTGVIEVSAGGFSTIALRGDGTVWYVGESTLQHTTPHGTPNAVINAVQVGGLSGIDAIAAGHRHFLALDYDSGNLFAWGHNGSGQVGDGSFLDAELPVLVLTGVASMSAGDGFSIAVKSDKTVWSWGRNTHGQLGLGDTTDRIVPTQVIGISNSIAAAAGGQHSLILLDDGSAVAFGNNEFGQLGDGTANSKSTPVVVFGLSGITAVSAGYHHSGAIGSAGEAYVWGRNFEGQCGGGSSSPVSFTLPQTVTFGSWVIDIACGYHFTVFRGNDGKVWGTGSNSDGQLDGSSVADQDDSQKILTPQPLPVVLDSTIPYADAGVDMITWSGRYVQLDPNVVNNSYPQTELTFAWSAVPSEGVIFMPDEFQQFPKVIITKATDNPSTVTLTLGVNNVGSGKGDVTDTMTIDVYDTACSAAIGIGLSADHPTDLVGDDCVTDLADLAVLAAGWLCDNSLEAAVSIQPVTK